MMRIERIISSKLKGIGDVDWTFPNGPVFIFCEDRNNLKTLGTLLYDLFYEQITSLTLKTQNSKGLLEVWIAGDKSSYHIRRNYDQQSNESVSPSTLVTDEGTGEKVSLPEDLTLGEYIFQLNQLTFRQGVVVNWPVNNHLDHLRLQVNNLRQGGDEGFSLMKVRASLAGAKKRVSEQKGSMELVKAEFDARRSDWEAAHRQQDEERLLLIEIKNLQENEGILSERIALGQRIQERLTLLTLNPDYRELRQLREEIYQLEERLRAVESNLRTLTNESKVDWTLIETLREECIEWASLQDQVERLGAQAQMQSEQIAELKGSLQTSGFEGLTNGEDKRLLTAETERAEAQDELNELTISKKDLENTERMYLEEKAILLNFGDIARVTETDKVKIEQRERHLKQWQSSKIGGSLDRKLRKHFKGICIEEKLADRLSQYYKGYQTSNFEEFTSRLKEFRDQQMLVEKLQIQIERLQERIVREDMLLKTVLYRSEILKQAFAASKVSDFPEWLNGWEAFQIKKQQLGLMLKEQQLLLEQSTMAEKKLYMCSEQLREKLETWNTLGTDRDTVLVTLFKVASHLRAKGESEREIAAHSKKYNSLLGDRNMEHLVNKLEPLADLERELRVFDDERLLELTAWQDERLEIRKQREKLEQCLKDSHKFISLTTLEKKIETLKQQWKAYENLHRAIDDAQLLLELSWQEWDTKYGKVLNNEMKWILSNISFSIDHGAIQRDLAKVKCDYFAYRMALAQLTLGGYLEAPLLFSIGDYDEGERFWVDIIEYFRKLSHTRQIIFITSDPQLGEKLIGSGWSSLNMRQK